VSSRPCCVLFLCGDRSQLALSSGWAIRNFGVTAAPASRRKTLVPDCRQGDTSQETNPSCVVQSVVAAHQWHIRRRFNYGVGGQRRVSGGGTVRTFWAGMGRSGRSCQGRGRDRRDPVRAVARFRVHPTVPAIERGWGRRERLVTQLEIRHGGIEAGRSGRVFPVFG